MGSGSLGTLVESWNGTVWRVVPSPNPSGSESVLEAVSCTSTTSCVAVGAQDVTAAAFSTLVESWDGNEWTVSPAPNPFGSISVLVGVSCVSFASCEAVGESIEVGGFILTGSATVLQVTTRSLLSGKPMARYSEALTATGGNPPYRWSIGSGTLPTGLHLNRSTGVISGTPSKLDSGTSTFTVKVVDKKIKTKHYPVTQQTLQRRAFITIS